MDTMSEKDNPQYSDDWQTQLTDVPLRLPFDRPPFLTQTFRSSSEQVHISPILRDSLKSLSQRENVELSLLLLAAFQVLLYRYSGQTDISMSICVSRHISLELENPLHCQTNRLLVRSKLADDPSFQQLLQRLRHEILATAVYQHPPIDTEVADRHFLEKREAPPPCQIEGVVQSELDLLPDMPERKHPFFSSHTAVSQPDLCLTIDEGKKGTVVLEYNAELFDASTIVRMGRHYQQLLESILAQPTSRLSDLPLLHSAERHQLLTDWSTTAGNDETTDETFSQLFEAQVRRAPEAIALCYDEIHITYAYLNERANHLARYLLTLEVHREDRIGIFLERSINAIVALLALFKVRATYVPLDLACPPARLKFLLADAQLKLLLTTVKSQFTTAVQSADMNVILRSSVIDDELKLTAERRSDTLAYMIYTSGSTGTPKGVLIQNSGLAVFIQSQIQNWHVESHSRILQFASLNFDASLSEIGMALLAGATLCLRTRESVLLGTDLAHLLMEEAITHVTLPPSILRTLPEQNSFVALRALIVAGEACSAQLAARWGSHYPLFNAYGPTEATIGATFAAYTHQSYRLPISGQRFPHTQIFILDRHLQPVPIDCVGEIYIAGQGLARGYHNRPDLTAEKFLPHPFSPLPGKRLYKSGDLARHRANGDIEYIGRADRQLKIRGFRIEPGEIESMIMRYPMVQEVVVIAREDMPGRKRLVAYLILAQEHPQTMRDIRSFLKEHLPGYMLPSAFVSLDAFPLSISGKVDYSALPAPDPFEEGVREVFVAPQTEIERSLASIWSEVLAAPSISLYDDFFALGGNSLLSFDVLTYVRAQYNLDLSFQALFGKSLLVDAVQAVTQALQSRQALSQLPREENRPG